MKSNPMIIDSLKYPRASLEAQSNRQRDQYLLWGYFPLPEADVVV
jgi:hypothetical protein